MTSDEVIAVGVYEPGPPGPSGTGAFESVPDAASLPDPADGIGVARYIVDTGDVVVSDGSVWRTLAWSP